MSMKVNRSLFFALTGTIAAAACNATQTAPPAAAPPTGSAPVVATTAAPIAATPPTTAAATETPDASAGAPVATATATATATAPPAASTSAPVASAPPPRTLPPPPRPAIDPSQRKPVGMDMGCAQSNATFDDTKTGCDDQVGDEADCGGTWNGYPSTESGSCPGPQRFKQRCFTYSTNFKPRVSQAALDCLSAAKGRACNGCAPWSCGHKALMNACPDSTADAWCDQIGSYCSEMSKKQCRAYLSGMNDKGRQAMVACLVNDCGKGFGKCLMGLSGQ